MLSAVIVFPAPVSPTMPRVSPCFRGEADAVDGSYDLAVGPVYDLKVFHLEEVGVLKFVHNAPPVSFSAEVERVAQAVADEVDGEGGNGDGDAGDGHEVGGTPCM